MSKFYCGLDLGQSVDYTALVIIEKHRDKSPAAYDVRHVERFALGTPYPEIVTKVAGMIKGPALGGASLVCDATGVGKPVVDLFRQAGLPALAVNITSGTDASSEGWDWYVPKRDLVSTVKVLLQSGRLKIASKLPAAELLVKELMAFQVKITTSANDTYGAWRENAHDDLVLALAMACYIAENHRYPQFLG